MMEHVEEDHSKFYLDHFLSSNPKAMVKIVRNLGQWPVSVCSLCGIKLTTAQGYYRHMNEEHKAFVKVS